MNIAMDSEKRSIIYGKKKIEYTLLYFDRQTMEIAVHPNQNVIVKAPLDADMGLIEKKILKRSRWILKQINYFKQFNPKTPERCYVNGETHLYLGKQYRLKLERGRENSVKLSRGFFHISSSQIMTSELVKKLLQQWYFDKAQLQFNESMERCWQKFNGLGLRKPIILIKRMQKRWGSFSDKGTITLNLDLIKAPKECIDYVVTHELCHLKYPDHSPQFYKLLDSFVPEWKKIKHKLEICLI
ncbi:SprT family zinc-dependent metalloprotease [Legionella pneumophila]